MTSSQIAYHLRELEIAKNPDSVHYSMPEIGPDDRAVLDIGCGIGQTFLASHPPPGALLVGIDIDRESLVYGKGNAPHIEFVHATAERLPFRSQLFDLVISRVSLPYTNIPRSLAEVERVLKTNGRIWITLHPFSMVRQDLARAVRAFDVRDLIHCGYVVANGVSLHVTGRQFPFVNSRFESFQTTGGIRRAVTRAGFRDVWVGSRHHHFVCTARKNR
jgi:SAM-dependent methyltransferase